MLIRKVVLYETTEVGDYNVNMEVSIGYSATNATHGYATTLKANRQSAGRRYRLKCLVTKL